MRALDDIEAAVDRVQHATDDEFVRLFRAAGLDPARDARFANWSGVDFSGCDLSGFDFTGANLARCRFDGASIKRARFDSAIVTRLALRKATDWQDHFDGWRRADRRPSGAHLPAGAIFLDAPFAPEMVVIPAGLGVIGSTPEETRRFKVSDEAAASEQPRREVRFDRPFAMARHPVTFDEYDLYCDRTGAAKPDDAGWGRGRRPVINVSWADAQGYLDWLSELVGHDYRLPTEEEWEYACRAGARTAFWWGDDWDPDRANGDRVVGRTSKAGRYPANGFGLHDTTGNVFEWCFDDFREAAGTSSPAASQISSSLATDTSNARRVVRGGSWSDVPRFLRSAFRFWFEPEVRGWFLGFRPARTPFTP